MNAEIRERTVHFDAAIFDMDGVVTHTAALHADAWKELFDSYLRSRTDLSGTAVAPFDRDADYRAYVDGKPRYEGVRSFLAARGIEIPEGDPADDTQQSTIYGLGKRKDILFERRLREQGVALYESTVALIHALREAGARIALVTSSQHGREVLASAGVTPLFDCVIDGIDAAKLRLRGKPNPDIFLEAARRLEVPARHALVVEDAIAGVEAGRRGGFGLVVGVNRGGNRTALAESGADIVVADLSEVTPESLDERFQEESELTARRESAMLQDAAWRIEQEGFDPAREQEMESVFTVGNGYLGVRGAPDAPFPGSQADMFVAGIYDRKQPSLPYSELEFLTTGRDDYEYREIVSLPFPFGIKVSVGGRVLDLTSGPWREHRRTLDLRAGVLAVHTRFVDEKGRSTLIEGWRCASLGDLHLLMQELHVTCENYSGMVEIDTSIIEADLALDHPHLQPVEVGGRDSLDVRLYSTQASRFTVAIASRSRMDDVDSERVYYQAQGRQGVPVRLRRYASVYTSRDGAEPAKAAMDHLKGKRWDEFESDRATHEAHWARYWQAADIETERSPATAQALRFNAYHLRIAADHDSKVSVGARTLSGRAYEGHVFWDAEVFMLPFYVHVCPDIARSMLLYRHATLEGARGRARELGYRGACYAWESTVNGADATPRRILLKTTRKEIPIYTGFEQVHVSADIAYGIWRYFDATHDEAFMLEAGVEILLETARFWASRCVRGTDRYHIRGVTGPDEYHHTVNDNAYTNWMARFNLHKALWAASWMAGHDSPRWDALCKTLALATEEVASWKAIADALYCPQPDASGVIEQFEGFFGLRERAVPESERFRPPLRRLFEADEINRSQLIKQADVLMLLYLFPDLFPREVLVANYNYYEPRTDHGSSLSPAIHAALAARLGLVREALAYWQRGLWLDLSNTMGNGSLGVHAACMAGEWQALVFGFLDVRFLEHGPVPDPAAVARLPESWGAVSFEMAYRGKRYPVRAARSEGGS